MGDGWAVSGVTATHVTHARKGPTMDEVTCTLEATLVPLLPFLAQHRQGTQ